MTRQLLVLIRHAKAADGPVDIDRPLAPRGIRDAAAVGRLLTEAGTVPDRVVVSPARRAQQSWIAAQSEVSGEVEVVVDERIYDNHVAALLEVIRDTPPAVQTLILVGHNPSFAELAHTLDNDEETSRDVRRELRAGFPTSAVAFFELSGPWGDVRPHSAVLTNFGVGRGQS